MNYDKNVCVDVSDIIKRLQGKIKLDFEVERMEPLFADQLAYNDFIKRHSVHHVKTADISSYEGNCYLGIDAGSTTTKVALVDEGPVLPGRLPDREAERYVPHIDNPLHSAKDPLLLFP